MAAKLFNEKNELIADLPDKGYEGERIRYKDVIYHGAGWIVPPEDRAGELRYFRYEIPSTSAPEAIPVIKDDGLPRFHRRGA
jgi:hypothetical protein